MQLEQYISDLLYRYQCVTIPNFGSFLTQQRSATIDAHNHTFYPPSKQVSFNQQLQDNDGLLAKYVADVQRITFEDALKEIEGRVAKWTTQLSNDVLSLEKIGDLRLTEDHKLIFSPSHNINYATEAFGLSSFVSQQILREVYKEEVLALEDAAPIALTPEKRKKRSMYPYAAAASIALLAFGFFGMDRYAKTQQQQQLVNEQKAREIVEHKVQTATFDIGQLPTLELKVVEKLPKYHIVGGAFRVERNAEKKVTQLLKKGFSAKRIGKNRYGLHQVSYASVNDKQEALQLLRDIKRNENSEAWLLVTK